MWRSSEVERRANLPTAEAVGGPKGSYASAVRSNGEGEGSGGANGLSLFELNCLVIAGFAPGTHASERMAEAERIMEKLELSKKHFRTPVSQYLRSSVIRVPLKEGSPRSAIQMAFEEFKTCGYVPVANHRDKVTGKESEKPIYLAGPQSPARRRRNQALRRAETYFRKHHPMLTADICFGSGRIEDEEGYAYVQISMDRDPTYFKLLRNRSVDRDALHKAITSPAPRVREKEEY